MFAISQQELSVASIKSSTQSVVLLQVFKMVKFEALRVTKKLKMLNYFSLWKFLNRLSCVKMELAEKVS